MSNIPTWLTMDLELIAANSRGNENLIAGALNGKRPKLASWLARNGADRAAVQRIASAVKQNEVPDFDPDAELAQHARTGTASATYSSTTVNGVTTTAAASGTPRTIETAAEIFARRQREAEAFGQSQPAASETLDPAAIYLRRRREGST